MFYHVYVSQFTYYIYFSFLLNLRDCLNPFKGDPTFGPHDASFDANDVLHGFMYWATVLHLLEPSHSPTFSTS